MTVGSNTQLQALSVCVTFTGNLTLQSSGITSLLALQGLRTITGDLRFEDTGLDDADLTALGDLVSIGGEIRIESNTLLHVCTVEEFADGLTPPASVDDRGGNNTTDVCQ